MGKDIFIGRDALGNYVSHGDLVASSAKEAIGRPGREMITGIVHRITAKSYYDLLDENGELMKDRYGKALVFSKHHTILLAHANDVDNYRKSLVEWENDNMEGLDK